MNRDYLINFWGSPLVLKPFPGIKTVVRPEDDFSVVKQFIEEYDQNRSRVKLSSRFEDVVKYGNKLIDVKTIIHGTIFKRVGTAFGMQQFRMNMRPVLVLASCGDGTFFGTYDRQVLTKSLIEVVMERYPRIVAHIICHSLGYCTPTSAAFILNDAANRQPNSCEWISACYYGNALQAVKEAINSRHSHSGFMAEYKQAYALVQRMIQTGEEPLFGSWS